MRFTHTHTRTRMIRTENTEEEAKRTNEKEIQEELHQNTTDSMNKSHMLNVHSIQLVLY